MTPDFKMGFALGVIATSLFILGVALIWGKG